MKSRILFSVGGGLIAALVLTCWGVAQRYRVEQNMTVHVEDLPITHYSGDPAHHSQFYGQYANRILTLTEQDDHHYDLTFHSRDPHVANIKFFSIDLSLFIPISPSWIKDRDLEAIALTEREWNRQQVTFKATAKEVAIEGGDGFEARHVHALELTRNSLNAGLWELQLFTIEGEQKALLYHGWFSLPLGVYKRVFESINTFSYWRHFWRLEHWVDPEGMEVALDQLRIMTTQHEVHTRYDPYELVPVAGEQARKARLLNVSFMQRWRDFTEHSDRIRFPAFARPGRYDPHILWENGFFRLSRLRGALIRRGLPSNGHSEIDEIELIFESPQSLVTRVIVGGLDLTTLPRIAPKNYTAGWTMPFGIAVPPTSQNYEELITNPPATSSYFGLMLDDEHRWLNHRRAGIDGVVLLRDEHCPRDLHVYLLSYERHRLIGHYILELEDIKE